MEGYPIENFWRHGGKCDIGKGINRDGLLQNKEGTMEYRINKRTGDHISVIGLGTSYIAEAEEKEAIQALEYAYENGINYADLATADAKTFIYYGKAFSSVRKDMYYQAHFGANYESGTYGWTTNVETIRRTVDAQLTALNTDYIEFCVIHGIT